jgi:hypothetical protein
MIECNSEYGIVIADVDPLPGYPPVNIINNTISYNSLGGIIFFDDSPASISNCILWDNIGYELELNALNSPRTVTISYSDVKGGQASCYVGTGHTLNWGSGMIDADPLFVDSSSGDYHLTWLSPCKDTGDTSVVTELYDFEGDPRITWPSVDMGADEFFTRLYHIGDVVPGGAIDIKTIGDPNIPQVKLVYSSGLLNTPIWTPYGYLYLTLPPSKTFLGSIQSNGVCVWSATLPTNWQTGKEHFFQALVGPIGNPVSALTNLMVLTVE